MRLRNPFKKKSSRGGDGGGRARSTPGGSPSNQAVGERLKRKLLEDATTESEFSETETLRLAAQAGDDGYEGDEEESSGLGAAVGETWMPWSQRTSGIGAQVSDDLHQDLIQKADKKPRKMPKMKLPALGAFWQREPERPNPAFRRRDWEDTVSDTNSESYSDGGWGEPLPFQDHVDSESDFITCREAPEKPEGRKGSKRPKLSLPKMKKMKKKMKKLKVKNRKPRRLPNSLRRRSSDSISDTSSGEYSD